MDHTFDHDAWCKHIYTKNTFEMYKKYSLINVKQYNSKTFQKDLLKSWSRQVQDFLEYTVVYIKWVHHFAIFLAFFVLFCKICFASYVLMWNVDRAIYIPKITSWQYYHGALEILNSLAWSRFNSVYTDVANSIQVRLLHTFFNPYIINTT